MVDVERFCGAVDVVRDGAGAVATVVMCLGDAVGAASRVARCVVDDADTGLAAECGEDDVECFRSVNIADVTWSADAKRETPWPAAIIKTMIRDETPRKFANLASAALLESPSKHIKRDLKGGTPENMARGKIGPDVLLGRFLGGGWVPSWVFAPPCSS